MYLFSRQTVLSGDAAAGGEWAVNIAARVTEVTGVPVSVWAAWFGAPLGSISWSAWVDSLDGLSTLAAVEGDATYMAMAEEGLRFNATPHMMSLRSPLHGGPNPDQRPPIGAVATLTTAVAANGQLGAAAAWGVEVSMHVETVTGEPVMCMADAFGTFGQMTWIGISADAKAADAANDKIATDAGYMAMLDRTGPLFVQGASHRVMSVRIG